MPIDYKDYHPKWTLIRRLILNRAGNKCEKCKVDNYAPNPVTGSKVVLTIAHLDYNKDNNRFNNLAALCQRCHLNHDRGRNIRSRKYGKDFKTQFTLNLYP